jgi:glycosyltransferase involved in cell wall biosynthesis
MFVSVVICTYRRPERLDLALVSLERQTYQGDDWELLVVENDHTSSLAMLEVIERHRHLLPLRHIVEPAVGLSNARNAGIRAANGEYLAYLDDDASASPGWLTALCTGCRVEHPDFFGGPCMPLYLTPKPEWFLDRYATGYHYGPHQCWLGKGEWLGGMNFGVSKGLCLALGGFRTDLGMSGATIAYGEDTDLMVRAWSNPDLKVLYLPDAPVHHEVRPEKMTLRWNIGASWAAGRSFQLVTPLMRTHALTGLLGDLAGIGRVIGSLRGCRSENGNWQQWVMDVVCPWLWSVSRDCHALLQGTPSRRGDLPSPVAAP